MLQKTYTHFHSFFLQVLTECPPHPAPCGQSDQGQDWCRFSDLLEFLVSFPACLDLTSFFFLFLPFEIGMDTLCLCHHCVLEACNLPGFIGLQHEEIFFLPDKSYLEPHNI